MVANIETEPTLKESVSKKKKGISKKEIAMISFAGAGVVSSLLFLFGTERGRGILDRLRRRDGKAKRELREDKSLPGLPDLPEDLDEVEERLRALKRSPYRFPSKPLNIYGKKRKWRVVTETPVSEYPARGRHGQVYRLVHGVGLPQNAEVPILAEFEITEGKGAIPEEVDRYGVVCLTKEVFNIAEVDQNIIASDTRKALEDRVAFITLARLVYDQETVQFQVGGGDCSRELVVKTYYSLGNFVGDEAAKEAGRPLLRRILEFVSDRIGIEWEVRGKENISGLPDGEMIFTYMGEGGTLGALGIKVLRLAEFEREKVLTVSHYQENEVGELALETGAWVVPVVVKGTGQILPRRGQIFPKGGEAIINIETPFAFVRDQETESSPEEILAANAFIRKKIEGLGHKHEGVLWEEY